MSQTVELKACIAIDVPCYETVTLDVPVQLLQDTETLKKYVAEHLQEEQDTGDLTGFEPEWENASNFRLVNLCKPEPEHPLGETMLLSGMPIARNYHDFGLEVAGRLREDENAPDWIIDLACQFKLLD